MRFTAPSILKHFQYTLLPQADANRALRRLLDSPEHRERLSRLSRGGRGLALHQVIFSSVRRERPHRAIYDRLFKPATKDVGGRTFLDVERFENLVAESDSLAPTRQDEVEVALLSLAFSLLQPDIGPRLISAIVERQSSFRGFFGLPRVAASVPNEPPIPLESEEQATVVRREPPAVDEPIVGPTNGAPHAQSAGEATLATIERETSPWRSSLESHREILLAARASRCSLGGAPQFAPKSFLAARRGERRAERDLSRAIRDLQSHCDLQDARMRSALESVGLPGPSSAPAAPDEDALVEWVEACGDLPEVIEKLARAVADAAAALAATGGRTPSDTGQAFATWEEVANHLRSKLNQLESLLAEAERQAGAVDELKARLFGSAGPDAMLWLVALPPEQVASILNCARHRPSLETLTPLLLRLVGEVAGWDSDLVLGAIEVLVEDRRDSPEGLAELFQFVPTTGLQSVLCSGRQVLGRAVLLVSFRASIAFGDPLVFNLIWPCKRWRDRSETVGRRVGPILDALQSVFLGVGSMEGVLSALASVPPSDDEDVSAVDARRMVLSEELAHRLDKPLGMDGHFYRLRALASRLLFANLCEPVRARDVQRVQVGLVELRRRHGADQLVPTVTAEYADSGIEHQHIRSLRRYIDDRLDELDSWVRDERRLASGDPPAVDADVMHRIDALLIAAHSESALVDTGRHEWLEFGLADVIRKVRQAEQLPQTLGFFDAVPHMDTLFCSGPGTARPEAWSWIPNGPHAERCFRLYIEGKTIGWLDLLQDGLRSAFADSPQTPEQLAQTFFDCGRFSVVEEAAKWPGLAEDSGVQRLAALARLESQRRVQLVEKLDLLERELPLLRRLETPSIAERVAGLERLIWEALDLVDQGLADTASSRCELAERELRALKADAAKEEESAALRTHEHVRWLEAAGVAAPSGATEADLENLVARTRANTANRRVHLDALAHFGAEPDVPARLIQAMRIYSAARAAPADWPTPSAASEAGFYVDLLREHSADWWVALRNSDQADHTHARISEIVELLCARLGNEIDAILGGNPDGAPMLEALLSPGAERVPAYYAALLEAKVVRRAGEGRRPPVLGPGPASGGDVRSLIEAEAAEPGDARLAQDVWREVRSSRRPAMSRLIASAWQWAARHGGPAVADHLETLYAWNLLGTSLAIAPAVSRRLLGLVIRDRKYLGERLGWGVNATDPVDALRRVTGVVGPADPAGWLAAYLTEISTASTGDIQREHFAMIMDAAGTEEMADWAWSALTGHPDQRTGRKSLLMLLNDFGERGGLEQIFNAVLPDERRYLTAFVALVDRASREPSAKLHAAIRQSFMRLAPHRSKNAPIIDFAEQLMHRLQFDDARIGVRIMSELERTQAGRAWRLLVTVEPDEADPPIDLTVELLSASDVADFGVAEGTPARVVVTQDQVVFDTREVEFLITPHIKAGARFVAIRIEGETGAGQRIQRDYRFEVHMDHGEPFEIITTDELLELYSGYDGKAVTGASFVGREVELETLRLAVGGTRPGAVVLYGVRRLGKTSILDEFKRRNCVTQGKTSRTLYLTIPVDLLQMPSNPDDFHDRFIRHIHQMVLYDDKNGTFHGYLAQRGISSETFRKAIALDPDLQDAPFLLRLRRLLDSIKALFSGRVSQVVLLFDEFDKLLEAYRRNMRPKVEELINQLRRAALELDDIGLVVAGSDLMKSLVGEYRSAFYGSATDLHLERFTEDKHFNEAKAIISPQRLQARRIFTDPVVQRIVAVTGGHPLYMRLVSCAAVCLSDRRRISMGTVHEAVRRLLENSVLAGHLPDPMNLVTQPLQALKLMDSDKEELLGRLLLLQLARSTSLERPWAMWQAIMGDDTLRSLAPRETWHKVRQGLEKANLIDANDRKQWAFRFPILAEALRVRGLHEQESLIADLESGPEARW